MANKKRCIGIMVPNRKLGKQVLQTYCRHTPKNISLFAFMPSSIKR
ncbi:MAG: hypothetical protein K0Q59_3735, partial [Paenibacillus sp.]|nr:hypothetical protein [Paenibacillus sp.]